MKLKEFKFKNLTVPGLSIFVDDKCVASGFIGEVLKQIPYLKDHEIKETNYYFDEFIIRLSNENPSVEEWDLMTVDQQENHIEINNIKVGYSHNIADILTRGFGNLDDNGFWEYVCKKG